MQILLLILPKPLKCGSLLTAILVVLTLFGCSDPTPSAPFCRSVPTALPENVSSEGAACLIRVNNSVLLIRHRLTGKLDFPAGGREGNETLQCTAHRETWEETGFNVEVGPLLSLTASDMPVFNCTADSSIAKLPAQFDAPDWSGLEVKLLEKVDPFLLSEDELRFADDLIPLRDAYVKAGKLTVAAHPL
ncbi:NUDIX hydrolase [Aestuariibacter sp. GS-14]|uniref:NUDIX hydrolase n=1 Tax=Aestuariibacter sp. GS-14 TaxID=2590670 RepID=UPI00112EA95F|nr:NUDIX hydrolase [Aestuariibacter sp. GS-14]TPV57862.1 NUDIX hydrolase [Aestuariibacter sp. GS-14]